MKTNPSSIDRIAPTRRPERPVKGHQRWTELLFVHWAFPPELIRPLVPETLELDLYDGRAWVGIVPFAMKDIRLSWMPRVLGLNFLETNVRTYVHKEGAPGVYFFSLEAASLLAVKMARWQWSLPYFHADMQMDITDDRIQYETRRRASGDRFTVDYTVGAALGPSAPDTFEHFLLERYYLFAQRQNVLLQGQVHHPPYPAHVAHIHTLSDGLLAAAGLPEPERPPDVVHWSPGVDVEVFGPWPSL